jgi:hypothetical protein
VGENVLHGGPEILGRRYDAAGATVGGRTAGHDPGRAGRHRGEDAALVAGDHDRRLAQRRVEQAAVEGVGDGHVHRGAGERVLRGGREREHERGLVGELEALAQRAARRDRRHGVGDVDRAYGEIVQQPRGRAGARVARLVEHELAHRLLGAPECDRLGDLVALERIERVLLDLREARRHHEDGQEQRDAHEHLVGRRARRAQALAHEAQEVRMRVKPVSVKTAAGTIESAPTSSRIWTALAPSAFT